MDIFNNDNENVNKVIVWTPHRMNKRQWAKNSGVCTCSLYVTSYVKNGKISFIQKFLRFLLLLIELSQVKKSLNFLKIFWKLLLCDR